MPDRISEGYTEALNAIAEAGREIARAVAAVTATPPWTTREAYATENPAETARQWDDARRDLEPVRQLMHDALSQRDALRVEVHALREIAPQLHQIWPGPSTDRAEVMDVVDVLTEQAREATQAPAEQPQPASGGNRTGGGLGERLRALGTGETRSLRKGLREIADEVDRLEHDREGLRLRAELAESGMAMLRQAKDEEEGA